MPLTVNDAQGNRTETLESYIAALGSSDVRLAIWREIYRGKRSTKTVSEIAASVGVDAKVVLTHGLHLAKHHVVTQGKARAPGSSTLETAYSKTSFGLAHRDRVLRGVGKPISSRIDRQTNLSSTTSGKPLQVRRAASPTRGRGPGTLNVLFATATPPSTNPLRVDAEVRKVLQGVRQSNHRDRINIIPSLAADARSLQQGLNDHRPGIVHFSGHGGGGALWMDDGKVTGAQSPALPFDVFARLVGATDTPPKVVVLNACHSVDSAQSLLNHGVKVVIAMSDAISDEAATAFSTTFYGAIASDQSVGAAFRQARVALETSDLGDEVDTPILTADEGVDPAKLRLLR